MFRQQHPEKQNKEVEWTAERYALSRAKQQTGLKSWPKLPQSQWCSCCRQWVEEVVTEMWLTILLWLLAFQRANVFLPSLQHRKEALRAQNGWESSTKLASGCFRIAQDCYGAGAYLQTISFFFFGVSLSEGLRSLLPPKIKAGRNRTTTIQLLSKKWHGDREKKKKR